MEMLMMILTKSTSIITQHIYPANCNILKQSIEGEKYLKLECLHC